MIRGQCPLTPDQMRLPQSHISNGADDFPGGDGPLLRKPKVMVDHQCPDNPPAGKKSKFKQYEHAKFAKTSL